MTFALGILLLAFGALFIWGVDSEVAGMNADLVGVAMLAVGAVGTFLALLSSARSRAPDRVVRYD
jgi:hypothetical protein